MVKSVILFKPLDSNLDQVCKQRVYSDVKYQIKRDGRKLLIR